jgi:hypothetical protein
MVPAGTAFDKAAKLALRIAGKTPITNYALTHVLPRIADLAADQIFMTEAIMAAIAQSAPEVKDRVKAFLEGRPAKLHDT